MKRALGLLILVAVVIAGLFSVRGALPFVPILGVSMEPEFKAGDLITIEEVSPSDIKVGDVIVFTVPPMVREAYDYPKVVVHRVVRAYTTDRDTTFRTQGDNVEGEDPFMVRARDIKGTPGRRIPYLGFPLLFLQSQQGLIFVVVSLCLLTLYLYAGELSRGSGKVQKRVLAPVIEENHRSSRLLEQRIETTEKGMVSTERALTNFASAIEVYAEHLKSHTSAIQGLSEASHELKHSAAEQNKVLSRVAEVMERIAPSQEEESNEQVEIEVPMVEQDTEESDVPSICPCSAGVMVRIAPSQEEESNEQVEIEVPMVEQDTEESLIENEIVAESELRAAERDLEERFASVYEELLLDSDRRENRCATTIPICKETTRHEPHEPETTASTRVDEITKEPGEQQTPVAEEQFVEKSSDLIEGSVELMVQPPIGLDLIPQLHRSLKSIAQVESLDLRVLKDKEITYSLVLQEPTPLLHFLRQLQEVDEIREGGKMSIAQQTRGQHTVTKFILTTEH